MHFNIKISPSAHPHLYSENKRQNKTEKLKETETKQTINNWHQAKFLSHKQSKVCLMYIKYSESVQSHARSSNYY